MELWLQLLWRQDAGPLSRRKAVLRDYRLVERLCADIEEAMGIGIGLTGVEGVAKGIYTRDTIYRNR